MFGFINSLAKTAVNVASLPIAAAADIVTLGGALTDNSQSYTVDKIEKLIEDLQSIVDSKK